MDRLTAAVDFLASVGSQYEVQECGCWLFNGKAKARSRPSVIVGSKGTTLGRALCYIVNGPPPESRYEAAHTCHTDECVNPEHFEWQTPEQNQHQNKTGLPVGVRQNPSGSFEARVKIRGVNYWSTHYSLEQAVQWRKGMKDVI